jgi:hypothetical protein
VKHQSSPGACFLWSAIFVAIAVGAFVFDTKLVKERALETPISVVGNFESAGCGSRKSRSEIRIKYSYLASTNGARPQQYFVTDIVGMANDSACEKALTTAAQTYPTQFFYYESAAPHKNTRSIEKRSSLPILLWVLLLACVPAALGLWQLEAQRKKKRKH